MNQKEKLQEATIKILQGKLIESISEKEAKDLIDYYSNSSDYNKYDMLYKLEPLIKDDIPVQEIKNIMDQHISYEVYRLPVDDWSPQQKLELNNIIWNYLQNQKDTYMSQNEQQLFTSFIKKGISLQKLEQICKLFPSAGKLRLASKILNNDQLSEKFMNDNTSDETMIQLSNQLTDTEKEQHKNTLKIKPNVSYNARITSQDFGGGRYRNTEHWKLMEDKLLEILSQLYKEGWEYIDSSLYIKVIYQFMDKDEDSSMTLTVYLGKNNLNKIVKMTTNLSKEPTEDNLNINIQNT